MKKIASVILVLSASANAADYYTIAANSSYLANLKYNAPDDSIVILDNKKQLELSQQYSDITRSYDVKSSYGLMSISDQYSYNSAMNSFSQSVFSQIKSYQVQTQRTNATNVVKNDPTLSSIENNGRVPVAIVGGAWGLYKGTSYTIKTSDKTSITPGASIQNKQASLSLVSPIINTSFAANNQNVTTSVSRGIVDHVSINFTNTTPVQPGTVPSNTVGVNYGIGL